MSLEGTFEERFEYYLREYSVNARESSMPTFPASDASAPLVNGLAASDSATKPVPSSMGARPLSAALRKFPDVEYDEPASVATSVLGGGLIPLSRIPGEVEDDTCGAVKSMLSALSESEGEVCCLKEDVAWLSAVQSVLECELASSESTRVTDIVRLSGNTGEGLSEYHQAELVAWAQLEQEDGGGLSSIHAPPSTAKPGPPCAEAVTDAAQSRAAQDAELLEHTEARLEGEAAGRRALAQHVEEEMERLNAELAEVQLAAHRRVGDDHRIRCVEAECGAMRSEATRLREAVGILEEEQAAWEAGSQLGRLGAGDESVGTPKRLAVDGVQHLGLQALQVELGEAKTKWACVCEANAALEEELRVAAAVRPALEALEGECEEACTNLALLREDLHASVQAEAAAQKVASEICHEVAAGRAEAAALGAQLARCEEEVAAAGRVAEELEAALKREHEATAELAERLQEVTKTELEAAALAFELSASKRLLSAEVTDLRSRISRLKQEATAAAIAHEMETRARDRSAEVLERLITAPASPSASPMVMQEAAGRAAQELDQTINDLQCAELVQLRAELKAAREEIAASATAAVEDRDQRHTEVEEAHRAEVAAFEEMAAAAQGAEAAMARACQQREDAVQEQHEASVGMLAEEARASRAAEEAALASACNLEAEKHTLQNELTELRRRIKVSEQAAAATPLADTRTAARRVKIPDEVPDEVDGCNREVLADCKPGDWDAQKAMLLERLHEAEARAEAENSRANQLEAANESATEETKGLHEALRRADLQVAAQEKDVVQVGDLMLFTRRVMQVARELRTRHNHTVQ
eukprot:gene19107-22845_t